MLARPGVTVVATAVFLGAAIAATAWDQSPSFDPAGTVGILAHSDDGTTREVQEGEVLPPSSELTFPVEVRGADYVYLLTRTGEQLRVLHPPSGLAWLAPDGAGSVVPQPPSMQPNDPLRPTWAPEGTGATEFILVAAPAPRDVQPDSQAASVETFLLPPAHVKGPSAGLAVVLDSVSVTFADPAP